MRGFERLLAFKHTTNNKEYMIKTNITKECMSEPNITNEALSVNVVSNGGYN